MLRRIQPSTLAVGASFTTSTPVLNRNNLFAKALDNEAGTKDIRKGPAVAHSLPVYKTTHKLHSGVRWKTANIVANVASGKDYRLSETHGEGSFDETGMYRDWLYGDERRYANYLALSLFALSVFLFYYTMRVMGAETWDIPAPVIAAQRKKLDSEDVTRSAAREISEDALATLKRPSSVSKMTA
eukprot:GILI01030562.1.p1 GENE.GILI01030562.1~~GILI01030562.1.p1  ORF type:complete len:185 (+),score=26.51 GILI01030562.1:28-582(+)